MEQTIKEIAKGKGERAEQAREIIQCNKEIDTERECPDCRVKFIAIGNENFCPKCGKEYEDLYQEKNRVK